MNGINLHRLQIFRTVFESLNVSATARQLRLSQPTISRHLAIFEDELGIKLFRNVGGRLEPTWEAQRLYAESGGLFDRLAQVETSVDSIRRGTQEALRIMASTALCMSIVPQAVGTMRRRMPELDIVLDGGPQKVQLAALREGAIDIAVGGRQHNRPDLRQTMIGELPLVAAMPRDHPLADQAHFDLCWLRDTDCVMHNPNAPMGKLILDHLNARDVRPRRSLTAYSILFAIGLAKGAGLCTIVDCVTAGQVGGPELAIVPLLEPISLDLVTLEPARQAERRTVAAFREAVAEAFSEAVPG